MNMSHSGSRFATVLIILGCLIAAGCFASARNNSFFGKTNPPSENVLHYVSGSEPESLDPQIPNLQNEARISLALFEGLAEYDPKTSEPVPALAERWEVNKDWSEVVFYLRRDGRFSNGDPITARDFVYTIRRGLTPGLGSRTASLAYPIKYAQAFNEGGVFVFDQNSKTFFLEKDFAESPEPTKTAAVSPLASPEDKKAVQAPAVAETEFHRGSRDWGQAFDSCDSHSSRSGINESPRIAQIEGLTPVFETTVLMKKRPLRKARERRQISFFFSLQISLLLKSS